MERVDSIDVVGLTEGLEVVDNMEGSKAIILARGKLGFLEVVFIRAAVGKPCGKVHPTTS